MILESHEMILESHREKLKEKGGWGLVSWGPQRFFSFGTVIFTFKTCVRL